MAAVDETHSTQFKEFSWTRKKIRPRIDNKGPRIDNSAYFAAIINISIGQYLQNKKQLRVFLLPRLSGLLLDSVKHCGINF